MEDQRRISRVNERLQERQRAVGQTFVSRTTLRFTRHGDEVPLVALRAVLANPLTTDRHITTMLEGQAAMAGTLSDQQ
jgi:glutamate decarboxylase